MKKNLKNAFTLLCTLPFLMTSCSEKEIQGGQTNSPVSGETVTLRIRSAASSAATKTILENDSRVLWEEGDVVQINGESYPVVPDPQEPSVALVHDVPEAVSYTAVYSYYRTSFENGTVRVDMKAPMDYREGSFGRFDNPMVAYSTDTELEFKNLLGILKVRVYGSRTLKSISLSGGSEILCGSFLLSESDLANGEYGNASFDENYWKSTSVAITLPEEGVSINSEKAFYFVLPPGTYNDGLTLTMVDMDGAVCARRTEALEIERAVIREMEPVEFTAAMELSTSGINPAATSVTYTVHGTPGAAVKTALIYESTWNELLYIGGYDVLDQWMENAEVAMLDEYGEYTVTATTAYNVSGAFVSLAADEGYKVFASYASGNELVGTFVADDVRTSPASGTPPQIELTLGETDYKSFSFNLKASEDAAIIRYWTLDAHWYDTQKNRDGMTDEEILLGMFVELDDGQFAAATSSGGLTASFTGLNQNTHYVMLAMSTSESGVNSEVAKIDVTTESYIDPSSTWSEITADAMLECGCFNVGTVQLHPLRVYENQDFPGLYKIDNPFVSHFGQLSGLPYGYMCHEDNDYDIIVDTRGGEVKIETYECGFNNTGLYTERHGDIYLASRALLLDDGSSYGWFDGNAIYLGDISMYSPSEGVVFGQSGQSVLYIDSSFMPGSSPSLSTEEFTKNEVTVDW